MRLIDADKLILHLNDYAYQEAPIEYEEDPFVYEAIKSCIEAVIEAPTVDAVRQGKWIGKYPVSSVCSECGYLINDSKVKVFAFCPNCGARMDK